MTEVGTRTQRQRLAAIGRMEIESRNGCHAVADAMVERVDPDHKLATWQRLEIKGFLFSKLYWEWDSGTWRGLAE